MGPRPSWTQNRGPDPDANIFEDVGQGACEREKERKGECLFMCILRTLLWRGGGGGALLVCHRCCRHADCCCLVHLSLGLSFSSHPDNMLTTWYYSFSCIRSAACLKTPSAGASILFLPFSLLILFLLFPFSSFSSLFSLFFFFSVSLYYPPPGSLCVAMCVSVSAICSCGLDSSRM